MISRNPTLLAGLPRALQGLRRRAGMTQQDLAERSGVGPGRIGAYESGRQVPSLETLELLLLALGADLLDLHQALVDARGAETAYLH